MPYLLSDDEHREISTAFSFLVNRCSHRFGLDVDLPVPTGRPFSHTERRYGIADPGLAARGGYHVEERGRQADSSELSPAEEAILSGEPPAAGSPAAGSGPVPDGGCAGEAITALGGDLGSSQLARDVDIQSVTKAMEDPRVVRVFAAWSDCMADRGYTYDDPWDPPNDPRFTEGTPAPEEPAVATADVECKVATGLIGVWHAVDVEIQTEMIDADRAGFDAAKADKDALVRAAHAVLEAAGTAGPVTGEGR